MAMQIIRDPGEFHDYARECQRNRKRVGLVPTMGCLHEGHLSLLDLAKTQCDVLIMSLFVNPTQFAAGEDLDQYPRDETADFAKGAGHGVDVVFCPDPAAMYPPGFQTTISLPQLSQSLCGASRPGHFSGVATVVAKLLQLAQPDIAVFGQKDAQQLAIIRQLASDLDFATTIIGAPIVRAEDGLALSSRNLYLTAEERQQATCLYRGLKASQHHFATGTMDGGRLLAAANSVIAASPIARIEYLELCDAVTLLPVETIGENSAILAVAAYFGRTRLIDNVVLEPRCV